MHGYDELHTKGHNEGVHEKMIGYEIGPEHCTVEGSDQGYNEGPDCLINQDSTKWCIDFVPGETMVEFTFSRPIYFRGYAIKAGDDIPERDPLVWEVRANDCSGNVTNFNPEHAHVEMHDAEHRDCPEREDYMKFNMNIPVWTDKVKFTFHRTREEQPHFQFCAVKFFG